MLIIRENGGIRNGGLNFDAKLRRESVNLKDLFIAHIGGIDAFARGLLIAEQIISERKLTELKSVRYESFDSGEGARFAAGGMSLSELRDHAAGIGEPELHSGKQERAENLINDTMFRNAF